MKGLKLAVLLCFIAVITVCATIFLMWWSYNNKYVELTRLFAAQEKKDEIVFDNMWKVIKTEAQVSERYSDDFRNNYKEIISARNYGGEMMKWITEQNPNFDPALYVKLSNVIESQRASFLNNQTTLIDIHREIETLVSKFPSSIFVGSRPVPKLDVVTSEQTDQIFKTHKEDSVSVF